MSVATAARRFMNDLRAARSVGGLPPAGPQLRDYPFRR
jgi:hypothetical protein